jgi:sterol desaturase/sphingolipid hydroxylase (fatty acid hydroxylase superfamily)
MRNLWPGEGAKQRRRAAPRDLLSAITGSRANYIASYAIDLACPLVLGYLGARQAPGWPMAIASTCAGLVAFSFVEYAIHRWLFHAPSGAMSAMHQAHHDAPHGHVALPCITSAVVAAVAWWGLSPIVGPAIACSFLCGLMSGYFYYATLHHLEHSVRITAVPFRWLQRRWAVHSVHHRLVDTNFGVTTSFWDRVLGTHYRSRRRAAL